MPINGSIINITGNEVLPIKNFCNKLFFAAKLRKTLLRLDFADISGDTFLIKGWAISRSGRHGILTIEVYFDGTLVGEALYGTTRTDIKEAYPTIRDSLQSGFRFSLKLSGKDISEAPYHTVRVKILGVAGSIYSVQTICTSDTSSQETERLALQPSPTAFRAWFELSKGERMGVNFVGDLCADFGLSDSARALVKAILRSGYPVSYIETAFRHVSRTTSIPRGISQEEYYKITLLHLNAPEILALTERMPAWAIEKQYVVGYWYWELSAIPQYWQNAFEYLDEIWVASQFVKEAVARETDLHVSCIPPSVLVTPTNAQREDFNLPKERFIFTYSFSPNSCAARKNPFAVIEAFRRAFGVSGKGPLLALKVHHFDKALPELKKDVYEAMESVHGKLILKNYSRQEMYDYLHLCDCYVSLHRSEGFGLGIAESMALGKPVIATAYSGNLDFMREDNSYQVTYTLREITPEDHTYQPVYNKIYSPGSLWAEPDIDHAAEFMSRVYENQEEARAVGQKAQEFMARTYSPAAQSEAIKKRLKSLSLP